MDKSRLQGVMVASVTPMTEQGQLDEGAVGALMDYYADSGLSGVLFPSSTGEYFAMTNEQRRRCVAAAARHNARRLTLIGNISEGSLAAAMENARAMADCGAEAVVDYYTYAADHSPLPILIYNHMTRLPSKVEIPTMMKLKDHPNIAGVKDTHNDAARLMTLSTLLREDEPFTVLAGGDGMAAYSALFHMEMLNALCAIRPDIFLALYQAGRQNDWAAASALQQRVNRLMGVFTAFKGGKSSAALFSQAVKGALYLKGLCTMRAVQLGYEIDESDLARLRQVLESV